jgi:hypothetical protein
MIMQWLLKLLWIWSPWLTCGLLLRTVIEAHIGLAHLRMRSTAEAAAGRV